ncbi:type I secretion system permease/ATPase [Phyllobacterium pellucidum]|uniref:type I secretion system permease/ATPase n=1 Tax=Phyllobacterium pellucidum TaxID=2740464 RepID=UPI001D158CB5|nr:type I secretion system permease/ATPase [Phyllobacterium sp. T1018]UGY10724.1 type I secretion system permease/ATPase [Phyllobacterium sp. T1018]
MKHEEQANLRVAMENGRQAARGNEQNRFDNLLAEMEETILKLYRREPEEGATAMPAAEKTSVEEMPIAAPVNPEPLDNATAIPLSETPDMKTETSAAGNPLAREVGKVIEGDRGPVMKREADRGAAASFHKRVATASFSDSFNNGVTAVRKNLVIVMGFTLFLNILVLAIPIYLFQISDRVLTSRSTDTLIMLTLVIVGAVVIQVVLDAIRRFILMRTAVEVAVQLGAPILSAAARASLNGNGKDYQVLGDLQQLRSFLTSGTLLSFFDAPIAPIFLVAVFFVHPHLGYIVVVSSLILICIAFINQRATAASFAEATNFQSRAMLHLDSMSRNSQIINALAMIPEAVRIWGRDMAGSLRAQVKAQDRNIVFATISKCSRLLTQVTMLGWGAHLAIDGQMTGGMVIAASIIAGRALAPIEGAIEGWNSFIQFRSAFGRIKNLLQTSPLNFERLRLPTPEGRLDVDRILYVPPPNKKVILNGISFTLMPGESLAIIGNSGAGKTTLGKMLVGSILPTSGSVRLDLMDLRNWDQRQFGENIGYLPQDVQLFPGTIKANIARMREDVTDEAIYDAAILADVHELIASFPQGYETVVAGDGAPLSGGQKQRIALARAFFGSPTLVVLDEPNSNLDSQGDAALTKALSHAKKHKITVVTITQRPALLSCVDKIMVLSNGTVTMFGSRATVLEAIARKNKEAGIMPSIEAAE